MACYVDGVARVSIARIRAAFAPREFKMMRSVHLSHGLLSCAVDIVHEESVGCFGGTRRWFSCPRCARRTVTIGFAYDGAGCRRCLRWRSRNRPTSKTLAPHIRPVGVASTTAA